MSLIADEGSPQLCDLWLAGNPFTGRITNSESYYRRVCIAFFYSRKKWRLDGKSVGPLEYMTCRSALIKSNVLAIMQVAPRTDGSDWVHVDKRYSSALPLRPQIRRSLGGLSFSLLFLAEVP